MPNLDVSDVLLDPDFMDDATYTRIAQTVGSNGRAISTPVTTAMKCVVTNADGRKITRLPEGGIIGGTILVHTKKLLSVGGGGFDADIVTWNGRDYTVVDVADYSRYGRGFIYAKCEILKVGE